MLSDPSPESDAGAQSDAEAEVVTSSGAADTEEASSLEAAELMPSTAKAELDMHAQSVATVASATKTKRSIQNVTANVEMCEASAFGRLEEHSLPLPRVVSAVS